MVLAILLNGVDDFGGEFFPRRFIHKLLGADRVQVNEVNLIGLDALGHFPKAVVAASFNQRGDARVAAVAHSRFTTSL